jgi:hypothetical protein
MSGAYEVECKGVNDFCRFKNQEEIPLLYVLDYQITRLCNRRNPTKAELCEIMTLEMFLRDLMECAGDSCDFPSFESSGCEYVREVLNYVRSTDSELSAFLDRMNDARFGVGTVRKALEEKGISNAMMLKMHDMSIPRRQRKDAINEVLKRGLPSVALDKAETKPKQKTWLGKLMTLLMIAVVATTPMLLRGRESVATPMLSGGREPGGGRWPVPEINGQTPWTPTHGPKNFIGPGNTLRVQDSNGQTPWILHGPQNRPQLTEIGPELTEIGPELSEIGPELPEMGDDVPMPKTPRRDELRPRQLYENPMPTVIHRSAGPDYLQYTRPGAVF